MHITILEVVICISSIVLLLAFGIGINGLFFHWANKRTDITKKEISISRGNIPFGYIYFHQDLESGFTRAYKFCFTGSVDITINKSTGWMQIHKGNTITTLQCNGRVSLFAKGKLQSDLPYEQFHEEFEDARKTFQDIKNRLLKIAYPDKINPPSLGRNIMPILV